MGVHLNVVSWPLWAAVCHSEKQRCIVMGPPETEGAGGQVPLVLFYYLFLAGSSLLHMGFL